ncbi:hypothetical protein CAOG_02395 [Capsaspora owczarzaki ATCC 30864]|uniref:hypothetical protein n=1 Tax=Capsaspora owczarzaki (strain ATCC 30864) TaxID=595528 RepID=UPI00035222ED|nr:hypothetical protein CAOG_02395 [Capsaspora owczarzaki ATCC 30864]|eukprot:XP_004349145.2 hypothetical protein CAOG_02395 [Capsaspora owczarzaki ATCC 30864]
MELVAETNDWPFGYNCTKSLSDGDLFVVAMLRSLMPVEASVPSSLSQVHPPPSHARKPFLRVVLHSCCSAWSVADAGSQTLVLSARIQGEIFRFCRSIIEIIYRRSSKGISCFFLLLGTLNAFCLFDNSIVYQFDVIACCPEWDGSDCQKQLLKLYQLGLQFSSLVFIYGLFLVFFPKRDESNAAEWRRSCISAGVCFAAVSIFASIHAIIATQEGVQSSMLSHYADVLGYFGVGFVLCQFVPQIYKTIKEKSAGSFSIPMLIIQTPGSFIFMYFLATGHNPEVTSWLPILITGILQTILLSSCIFFAIRDRRARKAQDLERKPLLEEVEVKATPMN